ncbi:MAG: hypothetical protein J6Q76_02790 [Clostridia bacterium]|nr:hypothetical protein [Clostridia bacterium]
MKRFIALLLCACFVVLLSSCEHAERIKQRQKEKEIISSQEAASRLAEANKHRLDYDLGNLRSLEDDVAVVVYFLNDYNSNWENRSTQKFISDEIIPALNFLEQNAESYGIKLELEIVETNVCWYNGKVLQKSENGVTTNNVFDSVAMEQGYQSDNDMYAQLNEKYGREVIPIMVFNKNGTSYGVNPRRGSDIVDKIMEHAMVFTSDYYGNSNNARGSQAPVIATSILYLYGAENLDEPDKRKDLAIQGEFYDDIMFNTTYDIDDSRITDATAFYIGWIDKTPKVFLEDGWDKTE